MEKRVINPTPWIKAFGINHGVEVRAAARTLYLSGQTATAADGSVLHPGDVKQQFRAAWANLQDALAAADMSAANIVRLNIYATDADAFMRDAGAEMAAAFGTKGVDLTCTFIGVTRLYHPDIVVELEATAAA